MRSICHVLKKKILLTLSLTVFTLKYHWNQVNLPLRWWWPVLCISRPVYSLRFLKQKVIILLFCLIIRTVHFRRNIILWNFDILFQCPDRNTVFHPWVCWNVTDRGPLPWTTMNRHVACWMSQHALRAQKEVARLDFVVKPRGQLLSRHVNDSLESKVLTKNRTSGIPGLDCPTHCISASPPGSAFLLVSAVTRFLVAHQLILVQI